VAEITALLDLASWPKGTQVLVRREEPPPGASYALFDPHGLRYQALITNSKDSDIAHLEARHGLYARVEHRIKETKWSATEVPQGSRGKLVKAALEVSTGEAPSERAGPCA
jgi:hypothetical protein